MNARTIHIQQNANIRHYFTLNSSTGFFFFSCCFVILVLNSYYMFFVHKLKKKYRPNTIRGIGNFQNWTQIPRFSSIWKKKYRASYSEVNWIHERIVFSILILDKINKQTNKHLYLGEWSEVICFADFVVLFLFFCTNAQSRYTYTRSLKKRQPQYHNKRKRIHTMPFLSISSDNPNSRKYEECNALGQSKNPNSNLLALYRCWIELSKRNAIPAYGTLSHTIFQIHLKSSN